ncbi:MAG: S-layer protein [Planctomycetaceae bacterium]|nr:S-layer protein [Planctomycetaceae bacterium]|tara:strand:- start:6637 stop:9159 length:2523 start_codon:yes stop_codon:yes gene_type:complete
MVFRSIFFVFLVLSLPVLLCANTLLADEQVAILPASFELMYPGAEQQLIMERRGPAGNFEGQVRDGVTWTSSDPNIVVVSDNRAKAVGDGEATIRGTWKGKSALAKVIVSGTSSELTWDFRRHVLPILAKRGCNSGACHGALAGKGGLKLSLRGYDPASDYWWITRQSRGRRVEPADPGRSLILTKPTGSVPHKGGVRLEINSDDYQLLGKWISDGAQAPGSDDPQLTAVQVLPDVVTLKPGDQQQLIVTARYSDGREEDVTEWAKFSSSNATVATVSPDGKIEVIGHGQGAIVVWFSSQIVLSEIKAPYPYQVSPDVYQHATKRNFIDNLVLDKLQSLNLAPSPRSEDAAFLRRAYLDTIGTLPSLAETRDFLDSGNRESDLQKSQSRRDAVIESLLEREEFIDYWTYKWSDLLLVNGRRLRPKAVKAYYDWIRSQVADGIAWDKLVQKIITASGNSYTDGATNFYSLHQTPEDMSENVSQAFLGLSIGCAKCHDHPLEKWTNDQYYAMANLFARVRGKGWGGDPRTGDGLRTLYVAPEGDLVQPRTGKPQPPAPLDGTPLPIDDPQDRRLALADWITSPENPYFSRAIANRVWANFFGVGLVDPIDDLRVSNPASNPELLDALATWLVEHDYDLKGLMRVILQSETYQRSSLPIAENKDDRRFYSRYYPRRLMAEVLHDAIAQVTEVPANFTHIAYDGSGIVETKEYPEGTRAIELYDSAVLAPFLKTFGRNTRNITCECERTNTPSLVQVLHISNGNTVNDRLRNEKSCVAKVIEAEFKNNEILRDAFLTTLARQPSNAEVKQLLPVLEMASKEERREVIEDLYWGIMSSREFLFNH